MGAHHLIAVARGHPERFDDRVVQGIEQRVHLRRGAALDEVDVQQWHGVLRSPAQVNIKPGQGNPGVKCLSRNIYAFQA